MLVLSRLRNETIEIDGGFEKGGISIMVVEVRQNGAVRLGIKATKHVTIHRGEIQALVDRQAQSIRLDGQARAED